MPNRGCPLCGGTGWVARGSSRVRCPGSGAVPPPGALPPETSSLAPQQQEQAPVGDAWSLYQERVSTPEASTEISGDTAATAPSPSRPYHKRFRNFNARVVEATDALFSARPSQLSHEERDVVFRKWVNDVSEAYGMEPPSFRWSTEADFGGGGFYRPLDHSITMSPNHQSVTTLIHETRHALQTKGKGAPMISPDIEVDARAWSLSLYYKVRPNLFKRLVREGRIFHISPADLDD